MGELALAVRAAHQAEWPTLGPWQSFSEVDFDLDITWALYQSEGAGTMLVPLQATPGPPELIDALQVEEGWL